ncbi:MAG: NTP transferase domain-containing protein [Anaerolineaceae bacterium]|nr:NTP transferase domain-containing protein [Anaerolineaceae bacterium]MCY4024026.1 NTP transferase domain-containing protein [Anaerolineaceae bacterium]
MEGVILAAGRGTRMRGLTERTPKPLLKVQGRPILEWSLRALRPAVRRVLVVTGYQGGQIAEYMAQQRIFGDYALVEQREQLGTGHALRACRDALTGPDFLVINGDDLFHAPSLRRLAATSAGVLAVQRQDGSEYGVLLKNRGGHLGRLHEKPPQGLYSPPVQVYVGACRLTRDILDLPLQLHPQRREYELTQLVTDYAQTRPVSIVETGFWFPLGRPEDLAAAQSLDLEGLMFA